MLPEMRKSSTVIVTQKALEEGMHLYTYFYFCQVWLKTVTNIVLAQQAP